MAGRKLGRHEITHIAAGGAGKRLPCRLGCEGPASVEVVISGKKSGLEVSIPGLSVQAGGLRHEEVRERKSRRFPKAGTLRYKMGTARIYHVDPKAKRNAVPADYIDRLKQLYKQAGGPMPSNTQYGWVAG